MPALRQPRTWPDSIHGANHRQPGTRAALLALLIGACAGGGGSGKPAGDGFELVAISVPENAVWKINRPIEFVFSAPVDFQSVSSNTINIRTAGGIPTTGSFELKRIDFDGDGIEETVEDDTVVFFPSCPTQPDYSDAGLKPGGETYVITVVGSPGGGSNSVRSSNQQPLLRTQMRSFTTPNSSIASIVFVDSAAGAPVPVTRLEGTTRTVDVTYVEIGGDADPARRVFFEFAPEDQTYAAVAGRSRSDALLPLNLYSDSTTRVAVMIAFNQAVDPSTTNISDRRLRLEHRDASGDWLPIDTRVELVSNCSGSGATVRLEPIGVLPSATLVRAVILPGFQDIVGDFQEIGLDRFAVARTAVLNYSTLNDPTVGADEFMESFDFGGDHLRSFEDRSALFDTPAARWDEGRLTAAFDFEGTGGPGGDFDWHIRAGEIFLFDTRSSTIIGGPGGAPFSTQYAFGGVVDVRNLVIEEGGVLRAQGQNTLQINATGTVRIDGELVVSGFNAKNVATLDSGHLPEIGGVGAAGGGRGGDASSRTTTSTPRGDTAEGPFGETGTGGRGGESGYARISLGIDARRPGGGGGGKFAADFDLVKQFEGRFAQNGYAGNENSTGCVTRRKPALGGDAGSGPFLDGDPSNDFYGVKPIVTIGSTGEIELVDLVRGELNRVWGGYGGGGGGDALPSTRCPTRGWTPASDEKGGGGGGGAGGVRIRALHEIVFGPMGKIQGRGGRGAAGENPKRVGGSGGSGSGGHVILESAVRIDLTNGSPELAPILHINTRGGARVADTRFGADTDSWGGGGGTGVIQLHVPSISPPSDDPSTSDIIVPTAALDRADPFTSVTSSTAIQMIPTFGARSKARTRWIPLGGASGTPRPVQFVFDGVQTAPGANEGEIVTSGERVPPLAALLGPEVIDGNTVSILSDELTLRIGGASLDPLRSSSVGGVSSDIYLRTPALLRNFTLRLEDANNLSRFSEFDVASARFDESSGDLDLLVEDLGITLASVAGETTTQFTLIPRFFRVRTGEKLDELPDSAFVRITFEGAGADELGQVDEANLLVPATGDVSRFNALPPGELRFFRFEVEFDLDALGQGLSKDTKPIAVEFVRLPFRF